MSSAQLEVTTQSARAFTAALVLAYTTTVRSGCWSQKAANSSAGQPRSSEQVASRSGISTRFSGDRILAVSPMKRTPETTSVCAAWSRPKRAISSESHTSRRFLRPGPAGPGARSSATPSRRCAPCSRRRMRVLQRRALGGRRLGRDARPGMLGVAGVAAASPRSGCSYSTSKMGITALMAQISFRRIEKSVALTSLVKAPMEMRSTPVSRKGAHAVQRDAAGNLEDGAAVVDGARPRAGWAGPCCPAAPWLRRRPAPRPAGPASRPRSRRTSPAPPPGAAACSTARDAAGRGDVVFLDQHGVVQADAVVGAAAHAHRVLLRQAQAGQRLAGVHDLRARAAHGLDIGGGLGRHGTEQLQEIERRASRPSAGRGPSLRSPARPGRRRCARLPAPASGSATCGSTCRNAASTQGAPQITAASRASTRALARRLVDQAGRQVAGADVFRQRPLHIRAREFAHAAGGKI